MDDKRTMREDVLARRDAMPRDEHRRACMAVCSELIDLFDEELAHRRNVTPDPDVCFAQPPFIVASYQAMGSEASVAAFVEHAYERGATVCFPSMMRCENAGDGRREHMVFRAVSRDQYDRGGIAFLDRPVRTCMPDDPELAAYPVIDPSLLDFVVVPLVAFDDSNNRLGYGGGNYDRLLPRLRDDATAVGVALEVQRIASVPCEPHDRALARIVCG